MPMPHVVRVVDDKVYDTKKATRIGGWTIVEGNNPNRRTKFTLAKTKAGQHFLLIQFVGDNKASITPIDHIEAARECALRCKVETFYEYFGDVPSA